MRISRRRLGMTLIELTITIAMFSVVMVIAIDSFMSILRISRETVQNQALQDHMEFLFGMMSKEIKFAQINYNRDTQAQCETYFKSIGGNGPVVPVNELYMTADSGKELRFINNHGQCVRYYTEKDVAANGIERLKVARCTPPDASTPCGPTNTQEAWVSPLNIAISNLKFDLTTFNDFKPAPTAGSLGTFRNVPSVTYYMKLTSGIWNPPSIDYSNFVSARNIEQF